MKFRSRTFLLLAGTMMAIVVLALSSIASANAASPASQQFRFFSRNTPGSAIAAKGGTIPYHGGPIMSGTNSVYTIFWQPTGSKVDPRYDKLLNRFFNDFSQSTVFQIARQYTDSHGKYASGVQLGGTWIDTQPYPGSFISDAQLRVEVTHAMKVNGWSSSIHHVFFVFPIPSEPICFDKAGKQCSGNVFCAYHSVYGTDTIYAAMPDLLCGTPTSPNHDPYADNVIDSSSHELMESLTDPLLNAWYSNSLGEIGDPCSTTWGKPNPKYHNGDITGNGHFYMVQEEWSNAVHGCALSYP